MGNFCSLQTNECVIKHVYILYPQYTPMMLACKEGNSEVVSAIMKETLDVMPDGIKRVLRVSLEVCI